MEIIIRILPFHSSDLPNSPHHQKEKNFFVTSIQLFYCRKGLMTLKNFRISKKMSLNNNKNYLLNVGNMTPSCLRGINTQYFTQDLFSKIDISCKMLFTHFPCQADC